MSRPNSFSDFFKFFPEIPPPRLKKFSSTLRREPKRSGLTLRRHRLKNEGAINLYQGQNVAIAHFVLFWLLSHLVFCWARGRCEGCEFNIITHDSSFCQAKIVKILYKILPKILYKVTKNICLFSTLKWQRLSIVKLLTHFTKVKLHSVFNDGILRNECFRRIDTLVY